MTLVGGSMAERSQGHLYNTCCVFGTNGELIAKHRQERQKKHRNFLLDKQPNDDEQEAAPL